MPSVWDHLLLFNMGRGWTPPYDAVASSIVHAYEPARRVLSAYTGNLVRILRNSDDAEADFGYVAKTGNLNTTAIAAWLGGSAGYVKTIYDQKGSDNITQASKANMPLYVASGQNGHPVARQSGAQWLQGAFTVGGALSQPISLFVVAKLNTANVDDDADYYLLYSDDATNQMYFRKRGIVAPIADLWAFHIGSILQGNDADDDWHVWSALGNGASSEFWIDGVSQTTGDAGAHNPDGLTWGAFRTGASNWPGDIASIVICDPSVNDAGRNAIQTAMAGYWGVTLP